MTQPDTVRLSRSAASNEVRDIGWRYLLGTLGASVPVPSLARGLELATAAVTACGEDADGHFRVDVRPDRVELSLQTRELGAVTGRDTLLARRIAAVIEQLDLRIAGATSAAMARPVQMLELAIDALDVGAVRPFWKAAMAYGDALADDDGQALVDPAGQLPTIWFQHMDGPRPQRNRLHLDLTVAHDEAEARVRAALDAGGHLVNDTYAPSFWVLADGEGNELCVCSWTGRDERDA